MGTIIQAKAVITAEDHTGSAFAAIEKKLAGLGKGAKASAEIDKLTRSLAQMEAKAKAIETYRAKDGAFAAVKARAAAASMSAQSAAAALAAAEKPTKALKAANRAAAKETALATKAVEEHRTALSAAGKALASAGIPVAHMVAEEKRLKTAMEATTATVAKREAAMVSSARRSAAISNVAAKGRQVGSGLVNMAGAGGMVPGLVGAIGAGLVAKKAVQEGAERQHERVRMSVSGMSDDEIAHAETEAGKLATTYTPVGRTEIMHMLRNARSVVGSYEEAAHIMEPMLKLRTVALGANPHNAGALNEDFDKLIKGMEIKGVTQDLPKFTKYMDGMAKAINVFGDTLRPTDYYEMFKYGRQATTNLSEEYMNTVAPTLAQELGGSSAGTAQAAFFRAIVGGKMSNLATNELNKIGLLDPSKVTKTKTGDVKGVAPGGVKGSKLAAENPYQWVQQYLLPALKAKGITDEHDIQERIARVFSNQVAAQLVSLFSTQQSRIEKDAGLVRGAKGLDASNDYIRKDAGIALQGLNKQVSSLLGTLTAPSMQTAAGLITDLAQAIGKLGEAAEEGSKQVTRPGQMLSDEAQSKVNRWGSMILTGEPNDWDSGRTLAYGRYRHQKQDAEARRGQLDEEIRKLETRIGEVPEAQRKGRYAPAVERLEKLKRSRAAIDEAVTEADSAYERLEQSETDRKRLGKIRMAREQELPEFGIGIQGGRRTFGFGPGGSNGSVPMVGDGGVTYSTYPPPRPGSGQSESTSTVAATLKEILGGGKIEAKVTEPVKVEVGTGTITVKVDGPGTITNTTSSGNIRLQGGGGLGTSMRESSPGGRGGV